MPHYGESPTINFPPNAQTTAISRKIMNEEQTAADTDFEDGPGEPNENDLPFSDTTENATPEVDEDPLTLAQGEATKWKDLAMRNQAELENFRKRMAREKTDAIRFANSSLLTELLPILVNFEMGLTAARNEGEESIITQGMEMVHRQMEEFLASNGAKEVIAESGEFDPLLHEAVDHEYNDKIPEGKIVRQLRRGYRLNDRLLRAANVTVSKGPAPLGEDNPEEAQA